MQEEFVIFFEKRRSTRLFICCRIGKSRQQFKQIEKNYLYDRAYIICKKNTLFFFEKGVPPAFLFAVAFTSPGYRQIFA